MFQDASLGFTATLLMEVSTFALKREKDWNFVWMLKIYRNGQQVNEAFYIPQKAVCFIQTEFEMQGYTAGIFIQDL